MEKKALFSGPRQEKSPSGNFFRLLPQGSPRNWELRPSGRPLRRRDFDTVGTRSNTNPNGTQSALTKEASRRAGTSMAFAAGASCHGLRQQRGKKGTKESSLHRRHVMRSRYHPSCCLCLPLEKENQSVEASSPLFHPTPVQGKRTRYFFSYFLAFNLVRKKTGGT